MILGLHLPSMHALCMLGISTDLARGMRRCDARCCVHAARHALTSAGNPTYQTPAVLSFRMNVTISGTSVASDGTRHSLSFPLFFGGDRRSQAR